jgi:hypothetical protein
MAFSAEKEIGEENEENHDGDESVSDHTIHPVAPPTRIEFEENIGGLQNSPAVVTVQMNGSGNIVVCLKVGSDGYIFRSYLFGARKKTLDFKPSGRLDYPFQLKMVCNEDRRKKCNLKFVLFIRNKKITHPDFFKMPNFLVEQHLQKNDQQLEKHLCECSNADSLQKTRQFYIQSETKKNRAAENPLSGTQLRRKIAYDAGLTVQESAKLSTKRSMWAMAKTSSREDKKAKNAKDQNGERLADRLDFLQGKIYLETFFSFL